MVAVDFGNLKTEKGVEKLNEYMSKNSYVCGYYASQDDIICLNKMAFIPSASSYPHANRWFMHILKKPEEIKQKWPQGKMQAQQVKKEQVEEVDLFAEETVEEKKAATKLIETKKKEAEGGKKKKEVINKSSLVIDIKPYSEKTNLDDLCVLIKKIQMNGLTWGESSKKVPVAFGLYKLQLMCTIIDDLVDTEEIIERIELVGMSEEQKEKMRQKREVEEEEVEEEDEDEDADAQNEFGCLVQSADIISFNKL